MKIKSVFGGKKLIYIFISVLILIFHLKFRILPDVYLYIFFFLLLFVSILWFVNEYWKSKLDKLFIEFPGRINSYKNFKRNYDLACVGGTQGLYAVDFSRQTEVSGFNWCMENQSLEYDFMMLKNFFSILKKDGKVLLFLTPFIAITNNLLVKKNYKYQIFLDKFLFTADKNKKFYFRDWLATNTLLRKKKDNLFLMTIHYYPVLYPVTILNLFKEIKCRNIELKKTDVLNNESLEKDANKRFKEFLKYNSVFSLEKYKILLNEINKFLNDRDLKLIIVIPPVSALLSKKMESNQINGKTHIDIISNSEISVLDYFKDKEFEDNSLFLDSYRLNAHGREQFMAKIIKDIK